MSVRPPAVAGSFYPSRAAQLTQELETLLAQVRANGTCRAIIAPHAGYVFSGRTAAHAFGRLPPDCQRVLLLGPSHYRSFAGGALPSPYLRAFATPLGEVELDEEALRIARESPLFSGPAGAHDPEHCLEVALPFLQRCTPNARVVPILVGNQTTLEETAQMAKALAPLIQEHTAVVVSSDFTHHGRAYGYLVFPETPELGERLRLRAERTARRAAEMDVRGFWHQVTVSDDSVCGFRPITVLLQLLAHTFSGEGRVLHVSTSGEVSGDWQQVVTYVAVGYSGRFVPWREEPEPSLAVLNRQEREALLSLARATMETHFTREEQLACWFADHPLTPNLLAPAGAFVTLHTKERALRGCIGSLRPLGSLVDTVVHCAESVLSDPRFPPVRYQELEQLEIEVSVLSPMTPVPGPEAIRLGEHGVVLKKGSATAVFLPQVARETGWSLETFLSRLAQKALLPADAWRQAELAVFTAQVFGEEELIEVES
ncbi:MAG: AmmeMemoRadiSam system protein B [Thermoanaerobaculaceae bacterium]